MGRKKSPVTRKRISQRHADPAATSSSSSASEASSLLGDVSPSSLRGLAAIKQEPMATERSQLPSPAPQGLHTALPIGGDAPRGRSSRRKRRSSGDDATSNRRREADSSEEAEEEGQEEVVTISVSDLEKWQQRVIIHVEDHFTNEQLKRIAEFGRVHGSVVQEARQYVSNMEMQLNRQLEEELAKLRAQAEEFVAKQNEGLRQHVEILEQKVAGLEQQVERLEKKVDTLEQEVGALELEKVQATTRQDEERQGNSEQVQQSHSPPNHRRQVQPANEEMDGNGENQLENGTHDTNGYRNGRENLNQKLVPSKQLIDGAVDHGRAAKVDQPLRHEVDLDKTQLRYQQHQRPANTGGTPSHPREVFTQERFHIESSEAPAGAGEWRKAK